MATTQKKIRRLAARRLRAAVLSGKVSTAVVSARVGRSERTVLSWVDGALPPSTVLGAIEELVR